VIHYCTYFDRHYLTRAITLYRSLVRHSPRFTLWTLCLDDDAFALMTGLDLPGVRPVPLAELERADPELLGVKSSRSPIEYYFTCSPSFPRFLFGRHPEIDLLIYLDADLSFYSDPAPILDELGDGSVLIVPHRFPEPLRHLEVYGIFNVGLVAVRNDARGGRILERWRAQCIEWCYDRLEDGRFADQRYLDAWPGQPGVVVLEHPGGGLAPWNVAGHRLDLKAEPPLVDERPLIFYHFQGVKELRPGIWDLGLDRYLVRSRALQDRLYRPYIRELREAARVVRESGARPVAAQAASLRTRRARWRHVIRRIAEGQAILIASDLLR
jgi:hypothetical protein